MKSAPFFQQTVFLTSGSIAIAIRNECLPACPKILIAQSSFARVMLSFFLGFIVQSAMIGGIDPETAAKGFEAIISSHLALIADA